MDEAKRLFSRAAVAALAGDPRAESLAREALEKIELARRELADNGICPAANLVRD